jgi:hypothetical protein
MKRLPVGSIYSEETNIFGDNLKWFVKIGKLTWEVTDDINAITRGIKAETVTEYLPDPRVDKFEQIVKIVGCQMLFG